MCSELSRRDFAKLGILTGIVQFLPSVTWAKDEADIEGLSKQIANLEKEASDLKLPLPNVGRAPAGGVIDSGNYYRVGMPRLVELIERSTGETTAPQLSSAAGSLLSDLHRLEYFRSYKAGERGPKPSPSSLKKYYIDLYNKCQINQGRQSIVAWHANFITSNRKRYENAVDGSAIPWYFAGIVHGLEASFNFLAHIHNGDYPLAKLTTHVPKGRPQPWDPPYDWERSAKDAFKLQGLWDKPHWPLELILYRLESYNGFGYHSKHINSPYLWCFSNNYKKGKFVADHQYNSNAVSQQCGGAVILKSLANSRVIQI
jgi:lysozyme family protein